MLTFELCVDPSGEEDYLAVVGAVLNALIQVPESEEIEHTYYLCIVGGDLTEGMIHSIFCCAVLVKNSVCAPYIGPVEVVVFLPCMYIV